MESDAARRQDEYRPSQRLLDLGRSGALCASRHLPRTVRNRLDVRACDRCQPDCRADSFVDGVRARRSGGDIPERAPQHRRGSERQARHRRRDRLLARALERTQRHGSAHDRDQHRVQREGDATLRQASRGFPRAYVGRRARFRHDPADRSRRAFVMGVLGTQRSDQNRARPRSMGCALAVNRARARNRLPFCPEPCERTLALDHYRLCDGRNVVGRREPPVFALRSQFRQLRRNIRRPFGRRDSASVVLPVVLRSVDRSRDRRAHGRPRAPRPLGAARKVAVS